VPTLAVSRRALAPVIALLTAIAAAVTFAAAPAGASTRVATRVDDPLAPAAVSALSDLHAWQAQRAAGSRAGAMVAASQYSAARRAVATMVAERAGVDADAVNLAWAKAGDTRMTVVLTGLAQVGVPYRSRGSSPETGFDCSGFTAYAWSSAGVALPHNDAAQMRATTKTTLAEALPGDLVRYPGHVMMYLGVADVIVHAPHTGAVVEVRNGLGKRSYQYADPLG
jgi:cell wall-associated NlpC family hydrolase